MSQVSVNSGQGVPVFYRVSTDNNPAHKTLQIQSDYPLIYTYTDSAGTLLGVSSVSNGASPYIASWTFQSNLPYPNTINVEVRDLASRMIIGTDSLDLFGADIYKVRITYQENIPAAHGFIQVLQDGNRTMMQADQIANSEFYFDDVEPRGTD